MNEDQVRQRLSDNWQAVQREVGDAAIGCGRSPEEIRVIGVSKYVDAACTAALLAAGCHELAESRPQSLWKKAESPELSSGVQWHMIGHLQTNKVRRLLRYRPIIHSVDSQRLLDCIAAESQSQELVTSVLLEVNISGDNAKTGLSPEATERILRQPLPGGVELIGLMAMAGWGTDTDEAKHQFEMLRELRDQWRQQFSLTLPELSMGMSGDFRQAIEAGSTMVRIGSRLFEGVLGEE